MVDDGREVEGAQLSWALPAFRKFRFLSETGQ